MTLQEQLQEALTARHNLLVGRAKVAIGLGERRVEYTQASLKDLERYIAELRAQIARKPPRRSRVYYVVPD